MSFAPGGVVLPHLLDVMRNVTLMDHHPLLQSNLADTMVGHGVVPEMIGKRAEQLVSCFSQVKNDVQGFASALVEVSQGLRPTLTIEFEDRAARLGDETAAADVGAGLGIGQVDDDIVNAPAIITRLITPHLFGELAQRGLQ